MNMVAQLSQKADIISKDEFAKLDLDDLAYVEIAEGVVCVSQIMGSLKYAVYFLGREQASASLEDVNAAHEATILDTDMLGIHVFGFLTEAMMLAGAAAAGIKLGD